MRANWNPGDIIILKLNEDLYSCALMSKVKNYLKYFLHFEKSDCFDIMEIMKIEPEFCTAELGVVKHLGCRKIKIKHSEKFDNSIPEFWIRPNLGGPGRAFKGGDLVRCNPDTGPDPLDPIVKPDLNPSSDIEIINKYELTNFMDYETIRKRLILCHKMGKNVDPLKESIFDIDISKT
ncbi:hypothetical protein [Methylobacterium indicum]|uniref:hypothetical protein n=1 Tax=Methylobacterium indicum TaxID=1775910 RepID=UPI0024354F60|nr:hypothetical protein [Methylobacterium indicum]